MTAAVICEWAAGTHGPWAEGDYRRARKFRGKRTSWKRADQFVSNEMTGSDDALRNSGGRSRELENRAGIPGARAVKPVGTASWCLDAGRAS